LNKSKKYITKYNGTEELFDEEKIRKSMRSAGADSQTTEDAIDSIKKNFKNYMNSGEIYRYAVKQLKKKNPSVAIKYTLKKAIMDLGPSGYVFEKYIAKILENYGYETKTGQIVRGFCVEHEVDVVAKKGMKHYMVECKYHNDSDYSSDIKTALYVHSRFEDIKKGCDAGLNDYNLEEGWFATNTKVTNEAAKYAKCVGLGVIAWHYPEAKNLEYYIENKKLYPVSILHGLNKKQKEILFENSIITIQDLLELNPDSLASTINTNIINAQKLFMQAEMLAGTLRQ